jgi:sec-independent protein translocase protein TatA
MNTLSSILLFGLQGWEWVIILAAILLLFGGKKIPELMKGIGKGVKGFKDGIKGLEEEINTDDTKK